MNNIFNFENGKAKITDPIRAIWYYQDIIDKYGEPLACKIFTVYHYMADLSLDNPFKDISELEKLETIIRGICPEIELEIDWNDPLVDEGIDFTRKLYETPTYRTYFASKILLDKIIFELQNIQPNLTKEFGNSSEIDKAYKVADVAREKTNKMYDEYLEEQGGKRVRGQGYKTTTNTNISPKELE